MGWSFACDRNHDKAACVRYLTDAAKRGGEGWKILAHTLRGNHLWSVWEKPDGERFIGLDLLKSGYPQTGWGYKDICESMGPCEVDCPLKYLEMVTEPEHNYGWREKVRAYHAAKRTKCTIAPGVKVTIFGKPYTVVEKRAKRGWIVKDENGDRYRATRNIQVSQ